MMVNCRAISSGSKSKMLSTGEGLAGNWREREGGRRGELINVGEIRLLKALCRRRFNKVIYCRLPPKSNTPPKNNDPLVNNGQLQIWKTMHSPCQTNASLCQKLNRMKSQL